MPQTAGQSAERTALARRRVLTVLAITEATVRYAASRLSNGTGPAEARRTVLFVAGELEATARALRRLALAGLSPRELAVELVASGVTQRRAAELVGRSRRSVRGYLGSGSGDRARLAAPPGDCAPAET